MLKMLLALRNRKGSRGFTLIELLVVVAIIGLLAAFAVPKLFEAINKAKAAPGQADLKTISAAMERYYFDNNHYPIPTGATAAVQATSVKTALAPYLKTSTSYVNGFSKGYIYATNAAGSGYVLVDAKNYIDPDSNGTMPFSCANVDTSNTTPVSVDLPEPTSEFQVLGSVSATANLATCTTTETITVDTN